MQYRQLIPFIFFVLLVSTGLIISPGCANVIPPAGGPRDSLPPVLLKVSPADSTRNFSGNRIVFTFNEFIDVQDPQGNLLVSPLSKNNPSVDYRLNTMTIKLKDTLEPNTTYTLNFGNAVRDFTEGNVLKGFSYTFSTGKYIDSLELRGRVILAETGKIDSTLIVMLHTSPEDSAVVTQRPRYVAKLDSRGNFVFKNLAPKTYHLYALKDEGGTRLYFNDRQLFAFAEKPIRIDAKNEPITLYAYASSSPTQATLSSFNLSNRNKNPAASVEKRLKYINNLVNGQQDLMSEFNMVFEQPLRSFDSTRIRLYTDSAYIEAVPYRFVADSNKKTIRLVNTWKENTWYHLILDKDFAEDSTGKKLLKTDTLHFKTKKLTDYGSLKLKLRNLDFSKHPVLLIMSGETIYKSFPLTGDEFSQALFLPGEYELRILNDENKNGKWDPGIFFGKHKQPEIVKPVERKISVKPSFVNEFEIAL